MQRRENFLFLLILLMVACEKNVPLTVVEPEIPYPKVQEALWPYFATFEQEAADRGLIVDLASTGIAASIVEINGHTIAGQCSYGGFRPNEIIIDRTFWNRSGSLYREMIVFHELGHCYLARDHLEDAFSNGLCKSIMRSGTCCCRDAYTTNNRAYYLDELFSINNSTR